MDPEIKELLKEDVALAKETNKSLKELLRLQRWSRWLNIIKWIIVVSSTFGALYYLQPMIDNALGYYQTLLETVSSTSISTLPRQ